jgi:hypothetical protein
MTSAEPAGQDEVHVVADVDGVTREGQAWFRAGRERRHLAWRSGGPADSGDIDRGITGTLAGIRQLAEAGPAPGPAS